MIGIVGYLSHARGFPRVAVVPRVNTARDSTAVEVLEAMLHSRLARFQWIAMIFPVEAGIARFDERFVRQDVRPHDAGRWIVPMLDGDRAWRRERGGPPGNVVEIVVFLRLDLVLLV